MLSSTFPYPPSRGGTEVRTFNLLKHLSQHHLITLVTQRGPAVTDADVAGLNDWVEELIMFPRPTNQQGGWLAKVKRFTDFLIQGVPPHVSHLYLPEMQQWVDDYVQAGKCQVITCEHSINEIYVRPEFTQQVPTLVNIHSSVYGSCRDQLRTGTSENPWRDRLNLPLLRRYEHRYCAKFSCLVVTTEEDRQQFQALYPASQIRVVPNGVDVAEFSYRAADPNGHQLIFTGAMDSLQNIDAARFLCVELLPALQQQYPNTTLMLVGARPVPEVLQLGDRPGVTVTGAVPAMRPYLHQATICVLPLRTGYGIKNKTLEAMAAGVPVIGSDRALEGLDVDGVNGPLRALRANRAEEYLRAIHLLFEDPHLREQLSNNGRSLVETEYTWEQAGNLYEQALLQLC